MPPSLWRQNDDRQRVLDATDIVRLVGDHVSLKPKGREYACLCPFHNDHNPSMYVVPSKQIFHCFVCGAGGNALDFTMRMHAMGFREALQFLADKAGIELTPFKPRGRAGSDSGEIDAARSGEVGGETGDHQFGVSKEELIGANAFALEFFRAILRHPEHGAASRAIVEQRGIAPEMVEQFKIGASPDRWDGLLKTIEAKRLNVEPFIAAGLLKRRESDSGYYDALRNRLIFPILDQIGRPIAFGGRKINPEDEPKYLNSPETSLFNKSATLFALPQAFRAIQNERCAIITEGYTDAIACHQAGIANVVATLGTALTPRHASMLRRICDKVVLLFDADEAGQKAADRAIDVFFTETIDVMVMSLPGGKDPDEVLKTDGGLEAFKEHFAKATPALKHRFFREEASLRGPIGSAARVRQIEENLAKLVELGLNTVSPLRHQTVIAEYARLAGVSEDVIVRSIPRERRRLAAPQTGGNVTDETSNRGSANSVPLRRIPRTAAEHAIACLLANPRLAVTFSSEARDAAESAAYAPHPTSEPLHGESDEGPHERDAGADADPVQLIASWMLERINSSLEPSLSALLTEHDHPEARRVATEFARHEEVRSQGDEAVIADSFRSALSRIAHERAGAAIEALSETVRSTPTTTPDAERRTAKLDSLAQMLELRRQQPQTGTIIPIRPRPLASRSTTK